MRKRLKYYGGNGYGGLKENGRYEVKATEDREFEKLSQAREYYNSLNEEKSLWDISGCPELIECHCYY